MPVEELDVAEEVLVEVAAADKRPTDRSHSVHREGHDEQNDRAPTPAGKPLEPGERTREALTCFGSHGGDRHTTFRCPLRVGDRRRALQTGPDACAVAPAERVAGLRK